MLATSSKRRAQRSISPHRGNSACTRAFPPPPKADCLWWDPCECQLRPRRGKIRYLIPAAASSTENYKSVRTVTLISKGGLPLVFRRIFALCPVFTRWVGYLPYPKRKKGHTGATAAFAGFTQCGWYGFCKCVFSYKSKFCKCPNGFSPCLSDAFQLHSRDSKIYFRCRLRLCHTSVTEKEMQILPQAQRLFRFYHTYHT